jgi:hypothetical protein
MTQHLTIGAAELKRLTVPVLPCASTDRYVSPILASVHIQRRGDWLVATTTDRYRCAVHRVPTEATEEFEVLLPTGVLKSILTLFGPTARSKPQLSLTVEDGVLVVDLAGQLHDGPFTSATVSYPLPSGQFPIDGVRGIVAKAVAMKPVATDRRMNWNLLADFKAADRGDGLTIRGGNADRPMLVTDNENFVAVIMPRIIKTWVGGERVAQAVVEAVELSGWADVLATPPAEPETPPSAVVVELGSK